MVSTHQAISYYFSESHIIHETCIVTSTSILYDALVFLNIIYLTTSVGNSEHCIKFGGYNLTG